jgi:hypothetical protein
VDERAGRSAVEQAGARLGFQTKIHSKSQGRLSILTFKNKTTTSAIQAPLADCWKRFAVLRKAGMAPGNLPLFRRSRRLVWCWIGLSANGRVAA